MWPLIAATAVSSGMGALSSSQSSKDAKDAAKSQISADERMFEIQSITDRMKIHSKNRSKKAQVKKQKVELKKRHKLIESLSKNPLIFGSIIFIVFSIFALPALLKGK